MISLGLRQRCDVPTSVRGLTALVRRWGKIGQLPRVLSPQAAMPVVPPPAAEPTAPATAVAARPLPLAIVSVERTRLATVWLGFADVVRMDSMLFVDLGPCHPERLLPLFSDWAPATLRRHLSGLHAWLSFCASAVWPACRPSLSQIMEFLASFCRGLHDRPLPLPTQDGPWRLLTFEVRRVHVSSGAVSECA